MEPEKTNPILSPDQALDVLVRQHGALLIERKELPGGLSYDLEIDGKRTKVGIYPKNQKITLQPRSEGEGGQSGRSKWIPDPSQKPPASRQMWIFPSDNFRCQVRRIICDFMGTDAQSDAQEMWKYNRWGSIVVKLYEATLQIQGKNSDAGEDIIRRIESCREMAMADLVNSAGPQRSVLLTGDIETFREDLEDLGFDLLDGFKKSPNGSLAIFTSDEELLIGFQEADRGLALEPLDNHHPEALQLYQQCARSDAEWVLLAGFRNSPDQGLLAFLLPIRYGSLHALEQLGSPGTDYSRQIVEFLIEGDHISRPLAKKVQTSSRGTEWTQISQAWANLVTRVRSDFDQAAPFIRFHFQVPDSATSKERDLTSLTPDLMESIACSSVNKGSWLYPWIQILNHCDSQDLQ